MNNTLGMFKSYPRTALVRGITVWKSICLLLVLSTFVCGFARGQDRTVVFGTNDTGVTKSILTWGLDLAWLNSHNVRRGVIYMGQPQVDVIRFSFTGDWPLVGGALSGGLTEFNSRMSIVNAYTDSHTKLYLNNDTDTYDPSYIGTDGKIDPVNWAQLINATRQQCVSSGRAVVSVAPYNEPDFNAVESSMTRLGDVCYELRNTFAAQFTGIRIYGGSTLNNDVAASWYNTLNALNGVDYLEEGCTHQLAGSFNNYAAFYQTVETNGDVGCNDELHNVMEAMVGAEYGMDTGIWWGPAELTRGEFVKASDGKRLGYAEHRPNWTAASVYRAPDGKVLGFVGESERQALPTAYRFFSKDRDVFYNGYGPQRSFTVTTTGSTGYQTSAHHNAEKLVKITWGDDVQPPINGQYYLVNRNSQKVMEVAGGGTADGTNIQQNSFSGANYQKWDVTPLPSTFGGDYSYFTITPAHTTGKTADLENSSYGDGGNLAQWPYTGAFNQLWFFEYVADGWFYIRNRWSGKYLDVNGASTADGANIIQWSGNGQTNQQWRLIPATVSSYDFAAPSQPGGRPTATPNAVSVNLAWNAVSASDLAGYNVLRSTTPGTGYEVIARGVTATTYTDNSANQNIPYYYVVKAVDTSLNRSANSQQAASTPTGAPTLVAKYDFESSLNDSSGNANHATITGTAAYTTGKVGTGSLVLNGTNNYLNLPSTVANFNQITVSSWVFWNGGSVWQRIFDFGNGTSQYMFLTPSSGSNTLLFEITNGGTTQQLTTSALPTNQWVHVAVALTGSTGQLYVNGTSVSSSPVTIKPSDFKPAVNSIGDSQYDADPLFSGNVDDFRIYNYALTSAEVRGGLFFGGDPALSGTSIGTAGSYNNNPNTTRDAALDGNLATYFDAAVADAAWVGIDAGAPYVVTKINYAPRSGWASRMAGGVFQASNTANFSSGVATLYTVPSAPPEGVYTSVPIAAGNSYRYFRYLGPAGGYCNIAEVAFQGLPGVSAPTGLSATAGDAQVSLNWNAVSGATGYNIKRSLTSGSGYTNVNSVSGGTTYSDTTVTNGTAYYYVVSASNATGEGANSTEAPATPLNPAQSWRLANFGTINNTGNAADEADPDMDGLKNLMERALGTNPNDAAGSGTAQQITIAGGRLTFSFTRDTAANDVTLGVWRADNLVGPWTELAHSTGGAPFTVVASGSGATVVESGTGAVLDVQVGDKFLIDDPAHPKSFMRLQVTQP